MLVRNFHINYQTMLFNYQAKPYLPKTFVFIITISNTLASFMTKTGGFPSLFSFVKNYLILNLG